MKNTKTINGRVYKVEPFFFTEAIELAHELGEIIAPGIGGLTGAFENIDTDNPEGSKVNGEGLGKALQDVFKRLPKEALVPLMEKLLKNTSTTIKGAKGDMHIVFDDNNCRENMNMVFQGDHMMDGFMLIPHILQVNFPPLRKMGASIGSRMKGILG